MFILVEYSMYQYQQNRGLSLSLSAIVDKFFNQKVKHVEKNRKSKEYKKIGSRVQE